MDDNTTKVIIALALLGFAAAAIGLGWDAKWAYGAAALFVFWLIASAD